MAENKTKNILYTLYTLLRGKTDVSKVNKLNLQLLKDNKSKGKKQIWLRDGYRMW